MFWRIAIILLTAVFVSSTVVGCRWGAGSGGGGGSEPTTATLHLQYRFPAQGAHECTGKIAWRLIPINLTGQEGTDTEVLSPELNVAPIPREGDCVTDYTQPDLRAGVWRMESLGTAFHEICQNQLNNGSNFLRVQAGNCAIG